MREGFQCCQGVNGCDEVIGKELRTVMQVAY